MNAFANSVFSILFSWLRSFLESLWRVVTAGSFSGLLTWLGDHWMILTAALCVICTVLDYLVWLIRWRPYVIWKKKITRLFRKKKQPTEEELRFDQGYVSGVELEVPEREAPASPLWEEPLYYPRSGEENTPVANASIPAFRQIETAARQEYRMEEGNDPIPETPQTAYRMQDDAPRTPRRRRSDRHEKKKSPLSEILTADDEQDIILDGLPPPVDRKEAFHQPVYPAQSSYPEWQEHQDGGRNG